jgi:hypothetical protein
MILMLANVEKMDFDWTRVTKNSSRREAIEGAGIVFGECIVVE